LEVKSQTDAVWSSKPKLHFGYIGTYNNKIGGPGPFERFLMGGAGLTGGFNSFVLGQDIIGLRGYPDNHVTPPLYDRYGSPSTGIQGGIVYNKFGMELRYPVVTSQTATVYSFVFTEAGNNWNNYQDFNPLIYTALQALAQGFSCPLSALLA